MRVLRWPGGGKKVAAVAQRTLPSIFTNELLNVQMAAPSPCLWRFVSSTASSSLVGRVGQATTCLCLQAAVKTQAKAASWSTAPFASTRVAAQAHSAFALS